MRVGLNLWNGLKLVGIYGMGLSVGISMLQGCGDGTSDSQLDLIGGEAAHGKKDFPAAVFLAVPSRLDNSMQRPFCGATKIADKAFLTAAHCVISSHGEKKHYALRGSKLVLNHGPELESAKKYIVTVKSVEAHESTENMYRALGERLSIALVEHASDVALILVDEETPNIGVATVRSEAPADTLDNVVLSGYGCERPPQLGKENDNETNGSGENLDQSPSKPRLKFAEATLTQKGLSTLRLRLTEREKQLVEAAERRRAEAEARAVEAGGKPTPQNMLQKEDVLICPGDSGSGLYLNNGKQDIVVGVNSIMAYSPDLPRFESIFARTDDGSKGKVASWITAKLEASKVEQTRTPEEKAFTHNLKCESKIQTSETDSNDYRFELAIKLRGGIVVNTDIESKVQFTRQEDGAVKNRELKAQSDPINFELFGLVGDSMFVDNAGIGQDTLLVMLLSSGDLKVMHIKHHFQTKEKVGVLAIDTNIISEDSACKLEPIER